MPSFREKIRNVFRHEKTGGIVWQPRIYYWYYGNGLQNRLPEGYTDDSMLKDLNNRFQPYQEVPDKYKHKTLIDIYADLKASPRYPEETLGIRVFRVALKRDDRITTKSVLGKDDQVVSVTQTPLGELRAVRNGERLVEYPVKTLDDVRVMKYILEDRDVDVKFDAEGFKIADRVFGEDGVVQAWIPVRSPLQTLIIDYMGLENAVYALNDYPEEIDDLLKVIEKPYDKIFDVIIKSPVEILNFGENIDANLTAPPIFARHLVPYYRKRVKQIQQSGKFCHIHMDGSLKPLLPLINAGGFDAIEAATPKPQGDVGLEELKDALGKTILLDGIPAILFTSRYSCKYLEEFAIKIVKTFSPNLILGVSDEAPPSADIEKVRFISDLLQR